MKIRLQNGLPIVSLTLARNGQSIVLNNVLFDTGCAATVFDIDALESIGVHIDFMMRTKCKVDFETMTVKLEE